jgi:predicted acyltransferase
MQLNKRSLALDVFRGMTVCFMIIVNSSGNWGTTYAPLLHATWNGFTPTDLVFPAFLFAVGNSMSFVMDKWKDMPQKDVLIKIFKRTFIIFLLGFLMYWFPFYKLDKEFNVISFSIDETRLFGVLQRIALCYGMASLLLYYFKPKVSLYLSVFILFAYWGVYIFFGPYNIHDNPVLSTDLFLFAENHLYHGEGFAFDPEGLLSTFPGLVNVFAGYFAGKYLQKNGRKYEGLSKLFMIGFLFIAAGFLWNYGFEINKKLWTSSYVVLTIGLSISLLALVVYYTDFLKETKGIYFFEVFGKNTLVIYLISELVLTFLWNITIHHKIAYTWIYENIFRNVGDYFGAFLFSLANMLFCWLIGYVLDKNKIYIKI